MIHMEKVNIIIIILCFTLIGIILGQIIETSQHSEGVVENNSSSHLQNQVSITPYDLITSINNTIIIHDHKDNSLYKISAEGKIQTIIRGDATSPPILQISGVCSDSLGNIYAADTIGDKIFKFDKFGAFITVWGETGSGSGEFMSPNGLTLIGGKREQISVCDTGNRRIQVFDTSGAFLGSYSIAGQKEIEKKNVILAPTNKTSKQEEILILPEINANPKSVDRNIVIKCADKSAPITLTIDRSYFLGAQKIVGNSMDVSVKNPEEWVPVLKQKLLDPVTQKTINATLSELQKNARTYKFTDTVEVDYIVQFVQQIPLSNDPDFQYPIEIIHDKSGNTFDKALLLYGLLYEMGYDVVYVSYPGLSHSAVGIRTENSLKNSVLVTYSCPDGNEYLLIDPDISSFMGRHLKQTYKTTDPYIVHILPQDDAHAKVFSPNKYLAEIMDSLNRMYEKYNFLTQKEKEVKGEELRKVRENRDKILSVLEFVESNPWNVEGAYMRIKNSKVNEITV